jgi:hypothetical protein
MTQLDCPRCQRPCRLVAGVLMCFSCGAAFRPVDVEELSQLRYLARRVAEWRDQGLSFDSRLIGEVSRELLAVEERLHVPRGFPEADAQASVVDPSPAAPPVPDTPTMHEPADSRAAARARRRRIRYGERYPGLPEPTTESMQEPVVAAASSRSQDLSQVGAQELPGPVDRFRLELAPEPMPQLPSGPSFSWSRVGAYLISERALNGLLGLGAFLILAAAVVISTINPTGLAALPHLAATVVTTLVLFGAGYVARQKFGLTKAGTALLAVGAAFIPLVVWTVGRDTSLSWDRPTIWLVASTVCIPIYFAWHALFRDRTFAALTLFAGASEVLAIAHQTGIPIEWGVCALAVMAMAYLLLASRLEKDWPVLSWALFWGAQITIPLAMLSLLIAKFFPDLWEASARVHASASFEYAAGTTWWLGVAFYLLAARLYRERRFEYAAAWLIPFAYLFTMTKMPWSSSWYGLSLAALAGVYIVAERYMLASRDVQPDEPDALRRLAIYVASRPVYQVGLALTVAAAAWPFATRMSLTATLFTLAIDYSIAAIVLRQRAWAYVSIGLLPVSYGLALWEIGVDANVRPLAWSLLSLGFLAGAEALARRSNEERRGLLETLIGLGHWRSRFASPTFLAGYAAGVVALALAGDLWWQSPAIMGVRDLATPVTLALFAVAATYVLSSATRRTSIFLYPATWILLVAVTSAAYVIFRQVGLTLSGSDWARLLAVLGVVYVAAAVVVDRVRGHYAKPLYLTGYAVALAAIPLSALDRAVNVEVIGGDVLLLAWSAWRVHLDRHPSYMWVVEHVFRDSRTTASRVARSLFLYACVWLFPVWLLLALSLLQPAPGPAQNGIALTLLAPAYAALGLLFRRVDSDYRKPWYIAGYALSGVGPLVALADPTLFMAALAVTIVLYIASAVVSRRNVWLYLVAPLTALLFWRGLDRLGLPLKFYGPAFVALGMAYFGAGLILHHGTVKRVTQPIRGTIGAFALPFFLACYPLSALGLALAANQQQAIVVAAFALAAILYAASALAFRESIFGYAIAGAVAVVYVVGMVASPLSTRYFGLGLLPGIALFLVGAELLRRRVDGRQPGPRGPEGIWRYSAGELLIDSWSTPFYLAVQAGTLSMVIYARFDWAVLAVSLLAAAALYGAFAGLFRHPIWLYPTSIAALLGYTAAAHALFPSFAVPDLAVTLIVPVWVLFWLGYWVGMKDPWHAPWARPLFAAAVPTVVASSVASIADSGTGLKTSVAYLILLVIYTVLRKDEWGAWVSVAFLAITVQEVLRLAGVPLENQPPVWAAIALAAGLCALALRPVSISSVTVWHRPLYSASLAAGAVAVFFAVVYEIHYASRSSLQALALTIAVTGLSVVAHGFSRGERMLIYAGIALLDVGSILELVVFKVGQPQAFVLPAGIYLLVVAYLEWRRGSPAKVKNVLETAALIVLLGTTLLQGVGLLGAGGERYTYDAILLFESLAVIGLGMALHWKRPFFGGSAVMVADVLIMLANPVRSMNTWYLVALIGFLMIGLVLFIEQRRRDIPLWVEQWRHQLEAWA